ncbi:MAG TPA: TolC family protein [Puia sp.]|nr:TolC family protein [Puia sp.]
MTMKKLLLWFLPVSLLSHMSQAQDKWDLRRCVGYALANNISVKQADVQARLAKLTLSQSKMNRIPTLVFSSGLGINSGNSLNPTNYTVVNQTVGYNSFSLQSSVLLFNGFNLRNVIAANRTAWEAALATTDKTKNDISLNVANAYLQVLLANEQAEAARAKLALSQSQLEITRKQVNAGTLPELNAAELESQVAQDSSNYISLMGTIQQNVLTLKAYMGLDAGTPFDVSTPPVDEIPVEKLIDVQPETVYALALANQPQQKADALQIESSRYFVKANKGAMYPQISIGGSLGTNFNTTPLTNYYSYLDRLDQPISIGYVQGSGARVLVDSATKSVLMESHTPYFKQLSSYFNQSVGLNISIPILNNGTLRTNYKKSKLNLRNAELQRDQDNLTLKNNIYQAYTAASTALQKYEANKISVDASGKSADYAQKRYAVGMLNTVDLLINQNNLFNAKINLLSSQYDYVFKMKVLEFYKGLGIKLSKD